VPAIASPRLLHFSVYPAGNILAERTDKKIGANRNGTFSRKLNAAVKAMSDFTVLSDWITEQVEIDVANPALRPAEHEK
jgi:hypothetical protein